MAVQKNVKPVVLCILDGWGNRADKTNNAISSASTPNWLRFLTDYQSSEILTHGAAVGLPSTQMGNSEVGHMNIGSGRIALPEFGRIDTMLSNGEMNDNLTLKDFISKLKKSGGTCHLMGLLSDGGVHSHQDQMAGFAKIIANNGVIVKIHAFTDGRDTSPKSAIGFFQKFQDDVKDYDNIEIVTLAGRFFAMDRDKRWDRIEQAYNLIVSAKGLKVDTWQDAIHTAYAHGETDEFISPTSLNHYEGMQDGDGILMANFRADRAREILTALLDKNFNEFQREKIINFSATAGAIKYSNELNTFIPPMVLPIAYKNTLGEYVSLLGLKQLRIAETEKYAHVTFFLNGGIETVFEGEDRILVPSPKVKTYDMQPEMSALEVTEKLEEAIASNQYDFIVVNYANADMVGHTGNMNAAIKAVEILDSCLGRLEIAIKNAGGVMLVTADHGNIEQLYDDVTQQAHTQHTLNPVPLVLVDPCEHYKNIRLFNGKLSDIAPTVLTLMQQKIPSEMTGDILISV